MAEEFHATHLARQNKMKTCMMGKRLVQNNVVGSQCVYLSNSSTQQLKPSD
jgi:hypothetical protein